MTKSSAFVTCSPRKHHITPIQHTLTHSLAFAFPRRAVLCCSVCLSVCLAPDLRLACKILFRSERNVRILHPEEEEEEEEEKQIVHCTVRSDSVMPLRSLQNALFNFNETTVASWTYLDDRRARPARGPSSALD